MIYHTHAHTHTYNYINIFTRMYIYVCVRVHLFRYAHIYLHHRCRWNIWAVMFKHYKHKSYEMGCKCEVETGLIEINYLKLIQFLQLGKNKATQQNLKL